MLHVLQEASQGVGTWVIAGKSAAALLAAQEVMAVDIYGLGERDRMADICNGDRVWRALHKQDRSCEWTLGPKDQDGEGWTSVCTITALHGDYRAIFFCPPSKNAYELLTHFDNAEHQVGYNLEHGFFATPEYVKHKKL